MPLSKIEANSLDIGQVGGRRNLVINGAMQVSQRGTTTSIGTDSGGYGVDRFRLGTAATTAADIKHSTTVPSGEGFSNSLHIDVTTADSTLAAGDALLLSHRFEGQNLQHLKKGSSGAKSLTLSFWVRSPKTGTHIAELYDSDNARHLSKSYTISTADTWEHKTITYAGDTSGSFNNDNNLSLLINFWLGAGTTYSSGTLQSSWGSVTNANRAAGQVNVFDSASNNFYITGVQLEVGDTATPFEHRSYGEELALCQRYYTFYGPHVVFVGRAYGASEMIFTAPCPQTLRASPTLTGAGDLKAYDHDSADTVQASAAGVFQFNADSASVALNVTTYSGLTDDRVVNVSLQGTGYIYLDSEL